MVKHWHGLPKDVVDAPSLEVCKARLEGAWNNLVSLPVAGGGLEGLQGPFLSKPFDDSMNPCEESQRW